MFADRAKIFIKSGKGGDGHVSFRRELYVPNGGPDGGDGGKGGDVIFEVDEGLNTLSDYRHRAKLLRRAGEEGGKKRCHGANGKDIDPESPGGNQSSRRQNPARVIADMSGENRRQVILKGGRGGLGNQHYATATMQVPKVCAARSGCPGAVGESGVESNCGRRACRISECRKIHLVVPSDQRKAEDRQLSFYNPASQSWCRRSVDGRRFRHG